ncbi:MAG TPA: helix-turn-helix transcriptional regulator [Marmoricola sp.]|jgi:DNA-binding XRE family transcriptional regulator|nr:helix-turn-helix transcriptional regulator [Marmoricola sp.]
MERRRAVLSVVESAAEPTEGRREPLWRDALGSQLRELRQARGETLAETAGRAGISLQYLSEIERGAKDPSSEMISAVAGALDEPLSELTLAVARKLHTAAAAQCSLGGYAALAMAA